ncbi:hypothetical protein [Glycomyces sp. YM15]|uniref:hypothetical protein n=1 Tax=Glycomyces sp. YM15 TaxID=2800446 RepID=UPI0019660BAF|nr:hypothetical protein [Glycomyces sp. YM15]
MAEADDFERTEYGKTTEGMTGSQYQVAENALLVQPQCGTDSCTCKTEEPAEAAWVKLMSAVPQANQINNLRAAREGTMMLPEGQTIQSMVSSIRPQPEADYALDTIRDEWKDFYEDFRVIGPKLQQGLTALSSAWKGDDFDAFEEQAETVVKNCQTLQDDIGGEDGTEGIIKILDDKQLEIFEQQGGTACVYPAPKFYMEGTSCGSHRIHIRPPFFKNCVIEANDEIKHAVELAGFDPTVVDEVQEGRQSTYDRWMEYVTANPDYEQNGLKGEALARSKADEYADRQLVAMGAKGSDQLEEQAAIVNEEVTERHSNVEAQVTEIQPDAKPSEPTTFNDGQTDLPDTGGLDIGDGGSGMPDLGGGGGDLDGMGKPEDLTSLSTDGLGGPGGQSGGGPTPDAYSGGDLGGLDEENPFSSGVTDPDDLGGQPHGSYGGPDLSTTGGNPPGYTGSTPGEYTGGGDLGGLDDDPWTSSELPDPDDVSGGLASGGGGQIPGGVGGPNSLGGGGTGLNPPVGLGGVGGRTPSTPAVRGLTTGASGHTSKRPSSIGGGLRGGSGSAPGGGRTPSGLGGGVGRGAGGMGSGAGAGRSAGGIGGAAGRTAGAAGAGAHGMAPGVGARGAGANEETKGTETWLVEEDDVWGGMPEDEDDDPYA